MSKYKNKYYSAPTVIQKWLFKTAVQEHQSKIGIEVIFDQGVTWKEASKSSFN